MSDCGVLSRWGLSVPRGGTVVGIAMLSLAPAVSMAQTGNQGPGLLGLEYANGVERAAAEANQTVFEALDPSCNPGGILDQTPNPGGPPPGAACTADQFFVYLNTRELVHSANELRRQGGSTVASLGVDQEGLGLALRWTAAEELAAQGSMATEFANGQLSSLAARMSALRFGAVGFGVAGLFEIDPSRAFASTQGAGDEGGLQATGETYTPWGGFLNMSFGYGGKDPTALEDAFDFDGNEITLGVDYRFGNNVILGGLLGLSEQAIDFDEAASAISVVDGKIDSEGSSLMLFALSQGERLVLSGSVGMQSLDYDVVRNIKYPSFNPDTESVYSLANSTPKADVTTATFNVGYTVGSRRFTFEPYFNLELLDVTIDAFSEHRSINLISNAAVSRRFDLLVSEQKIESTDASLGFRFQYVMTPRIGVIIPYLILEAHKELDDDARTITAGYAALQDVLGSSTFAVPTDVPDETYTTAAIGFSMVLRGGRQRVADGPIVGGLSGFLQFKTVENLTNYEDKIITGGLRYEF